MEKIVLLNCAKSKTGINIIHYGYQDPHEKYQKGFQICEQWLNGVDIYDTLTDKDFGTIYDAEFGYHDTYNGNARRVIKKLVAPTGEIVYQEK